MLSCAFGKKQRKSHCQRQGPVYQGDHSAQGHVPKSVSCQNPNKLRTIYWLNLEPRAQGLCQLSSSGRILRVRNLCALKRDVLTAKSVLVSPDLGTAPTLFHLTALSKRRQALFSWTHRFAFLTHSHGSSSQPVSCRSFSPKEN